jgi:uncharacterized protein YidB (DUF937 family)
MVLGLGALAGAGALAAKSGKVQPAIKAASALRQQLMLSGYALPKSVLGNIGSTAIESAERGSLRPLKELFSKTTAKDALAAWKAGTPTGANYGQTLKIAGKELPSPGRAMGALDTATQKAQQRAGLTPAESARATMQAPLPHELASVLDSPAARYAIPFRRTPFNQFIEGWKTMKPANLKAHPVVAGTAAVAGAAHGALTADERFPTSVGLGTAFASKYGMPYAGAAVLGRMLAGGNADAGIAAQMLPVSEYGLTSGITEPLAPFKNPAIRRIIDDWAGGGR